MKRVVFRVVAGVAALIVIVGVYVGVILLRARGGLPQWGGSVPVDGLESPVTVVRDEHGIPFIRASSEHELYFAQGFVHAQDRFWQMALIRQRMRGSLAEWLGAVALEQDRFARTFGWAQLAERSLRATPLEDWELLEAYMEGVNAWLESPAFRRPPEMAILHVQPEPWRVSDSFLVAYQLHQSQVRGGLEWVRLFLKESGGSAMGAEMVDETVLLSKPIIPPAGEHAIPQPTVPFEDGSFSDSWVVSGEHTASGKPLVANDPHVDLSLPGFWQLQHHTVDGRRMAGATLPGLPGIMLGHNGSLAWAATNARVDVRDFALVELHPEDPNRYRRGPDVRWREFETRLETIGVRFAADRTETVRSTPQGVTWPRGAAGFRSTDVALEVRDVPGDLPYTNPGALLRLNRAASVSDGIEAMESYTGPPMSMSVADTSGSIGYVVAGRIPVRPVAHATRVGLAPEDGNERTYLAYAENPRLLNPPSGRIVTANQRIVGEEYSHYLTDGWMSPHRALRIHEMLDLRDLHDPASFQAMQTDSLSPVARQIVPLLLDVEPAEEADARLVDLLRDWDHRFSLDDSAAVVFLTWVQELYHRVVLDEMGSVTPPGFYVPLIRALNGEHPEWCDDSRTEPTESCSESLRLSLTEARVALHDAFGSDPDGWRWGDVARFRLPHMGFAGTPILDRLFSGSTPIAGGPTSLFANYVNHLRAPRLSRTGSCSVYQGIYDLSDLDGSLFMAQGGSSGHFRSPFYNNLTPLWVAGERIRLVPEEVTPIAQLTLTPVGRVE